MKISQIIYLGLALFLTVQNAAGHHLANCGLSQGVDACGCSDVTVRAARPIRPVKFAEPYVIREAASLKAAPVSGGCGSLNQHRHFSGPSVVDLLKPSCGPVAPRFRPVGDLCSCTSQITDVTPAYPGRPVCRTCKKTTECQCHDEHAPKVYTSFSASNSELNAFEDDGLSFDEQESIYNAQCVPTVPADAVSLSLAFGLAHKATRTIPEGSLAFGPKSAPIDGSIRKTYVDIPEERLLTVEKPVVELKFSPKPSYSATYEEILAQQEALEQQRIELEAQQPEAQAPAFISYRDLGYQPVAPSKTNFISTVSTQETQTDDSACGPVGPPVPGYVSGNVIVRSETVQENDGDFNNDDGSYEQDSDQYSSYSSEEEGSCNGGNGSSGFLARLRASARAQSGSGYGSHSRGSGYGSYSSGSGYGTYSSGSSCGTPSRGSGCGSPSCGSGCGCGQ